jgi:hypothetical protein
LSEDQRFATARLNYGHVLDAGDGIETNEAIPENSLLIKAR